MTSRDDNFEEPKDDTVDGAILIVRDEGWECPTREVRVYRCENGAGRITGISNSMFGDPVSTTNLLSREELDQLLDRLYSVRIPALVDFPTGCDGGTTEIECDAGYYGKVHYRWWCEPPKGWEPLDNFARHVFELAGLSDDNGCLSDLH